MIKKKFRVGDTVTTYLQKLGSPKHLAIKGKIKKISTQTPQGGAYLYTITGGKLMDDFETRKVK